MKTRGFTLIELMIAVAIVAILATIAYPSYRDQVRRSHRTEARSALLQLQVAQEKFFLQNNRYASNSELTLTGGAGLGLSATTPNNYYGIAIAAGSTATTYTATATAAGGQADDTRCSIFSIDHTGQQLSRNSSNAASTGCWK